MTDNTATDVLEGKGALSGATPDPGITRRGLLRAGAAGAIALTGASALAACGATGAKSKLGGRPKRGGTLTGALITGGSAEVLEVATCFASPDIARVQNIWDGLYRIGPDGYGVPSLATAESSPDAKLWTFHLRHGVTWHDGKPLTADDLVYTIRSWSDKSSYFAPIAVGLVDFKGVRKRGPLTVEVPLTKGVAEFPLMTAIPNAYVIQNGYKHGDNRVGTGPFKYESFTPGQRSVFSANRNYWVPNEPYVDTLIIDSSFTDESARVNAVLGGAADMAPLMPFTLAKTYTSTGNIRVLEHTSPAFYAPACRVDVKPFRDPRVTLALKLLVDRPAMIEFAYAGYASLGNDVPGHGLPFFASDFKRERDVGQARSLLKAAGYPDLSLQLKTSAVAAGIVELSTLYAQQAKHAGVSVQVVEIDPAVYYTPAGGYGKNTFSAQWWYTLPCLSYFYLAALNRNAAFPETHWGDPKSDALLSDALAETNKATASDKWHAVQQLQFDRGGYIIPANYDSVDAYAPRVHGIRATAGGPADNWNFKTAWL